MDRWPGRLGALLVLAACGAILLGLHWDDLFPPQRVDSAGEDPAAACIARRFGDIEGMLEDGVIETAQEAAFKARAEAFCRAQAGGPQPPQAK